MQEVAEHSSSGHSPDNSEIEPKLWIWFDKNLLKWRIYMDKKPNSNPNGGFNWIQNYKNPNGGFISKKIKILIQMADLFPKKYRF